MNKEFHIIEFDTIPSTNTYLKENYESLDDYTVIKCNHQTNGRGRSGASWLDDNGCLLFSILIKDRNIIDNVNINTIPILTSIAVCKELEVEATEIMEIKWPNDIMLYNKKICGILLESVVTNKVEALIVGIGININNTKIHEDIKHKASSLRLLTYHSYDINNILLNIISNFNELLSQASNTLNLDCLLYYNMRNYLYKKEVTFIYNNKVLSGICGNINEYGELEIETQEEKIKLYYGEVSLKGVYK